MCLKTTVKKKGTIYVSKWIFKTEADCEKFIRFALGEGHSNIENNVHISLHYNKNNFLTRQIGARSGAVGEGWI